MISIKEKHIRQNFQRAKGRWDWKMSGYRDYYGIRRLVVAAMKIGEKQNWKCALTGDSLEFTRGGTFFAGKWCNPKSCTIVRIDSSIGYTEDNIQLVTHEANTLKGAIEPDQLFELVSKINNNREERQHDMVC